MNELYKLLKALKAKGSINAEEKAKVQEMYKALDAETQEVLADEVNAVSSLPEQGEQEAGAEVKAFVKNLIELESGKNKTETMEQLKKEFNEWAKKEMEAMKNNVAHHNPNQKEKRKHLNNYLRTAMLAVVDNDVAKLKEMTTDSANSPFAGFVTDQELNAEITHLTTEHGKARKLFSVVQLTKHSYAKNTLTTDVTITWAGEAQALTSTQIVLGQEDLELKKLFAIVTLTRELLEDSEIDLVSFIGTRVAEGFARKEDEAFFTGEGSGDTANGGYTGALHADGVNEVTIPVRGSKNGQAFAHLTADDLLAMQDASPQAVAKNGIYVMHRSIRNLVRALKDSNGTPIYQSPSENGPATIWGRPVEEVEAMPDTGDSEADTPFILFGDFKTAGLLGTKAGTVMDMFDAGIVRNVAGNADINLITTDRKAIRWIERVGAVILYPKALTVLKTGGGS